MTPDYEKQLEAQIDAELKGLGELRAPATLAPRVMRLLEQRAMRPWYRQSWSNWPRGVQVASFASLALMFAGLCAGVWMLANGGAGQGIGSLLGGLSRNVELVFNMIDVVQGALVVAAQHFGTWFMVGCIAALAAVWTACIGLGTVFVRLGMQPAVVRN